MDSEPEDTIDSKYIIKSKKGSGATSTAFIVKERNNNEEYIAKILIKEDEAQKLYYQNEIDNLTVLKPFNNKYIIKIIDSGIGPVKRKNRNKGKPLNQRYIVFEHCEKRELDDFITYSNRGGIGEDFSKIIFHKIVEGVQLIHTKGLCHRDIKLQNILLHDYVTPKIADFGYSTTNDPKLEEYLGTYKNIAPEVANLNPYDGQKADIFSLGQALFYLTFGEPIFKEDKDKNKDEGPKISKFCKIIFAGEIEEYWGEIIEIIGKEPSKDFKDLYFKMISLEPKERPSIDEILNHPWFKINTPGKNQSILENEIKIEFKNREPEIEKHINFEIEAADKESERIDKTRAISSEEEKKYFDSNIVPKEIPEEFDESFCIEIKGYINPINLMDKLYDQMLDKMNNDNCFIDNPDKYKLKIIFIEGDENDKIKGNYIKMKIKLYKFKERLILKFVKLDGDKENFFDKFKTISNLVKNII